VAQLVIEIVHSLRFVKEYRTFDAPVVRVGRSYTNDLILSDPYVSAEHLRISAREDGWLVEDISRENGMYARKSARVIQEVHASSGDEIVIGRTRLRLLSPSHPVASTKPLASPQGFLKRISYPVNVWSILIFAFMVFMFHVHLHSSENLSLLKLTSGGLGFLFLALLWASVWAFVGRIIKHSAQFAAQLSLSVLFLALLLPLTILSEYIGYFVNSMMIEAGSALLFWGVLFTAFLVGNLTIATHVSLRNRVIVCTTITAFIIAIMTLLYYTFKDEFNPNPVYYATLKPPFIKLLPSRSADQFLTDADKIFDFTQKPKVLRSETKEAFVP
jgi:pSer/pThr/pTyr-binding forkhead associated (FHA) protein